MKLENISSRHPNLCYRTMLHLEFRTPRTRQVSTPRHINAASRAGCPQHADSVRLAALWWRRGWWNLQCIACHNIGTFPGVPGFRDGTFPRLHDGATMHAMT